MIKFSTMKKQILVIALVFIYLLPKAQIMKGSDINQRITEIENRIALKELVDNFSILADKKDITAQMLLFTEDANVETYINGQKVTSLNGRKQIGETFASFLNNFETVYHINGQQVVNINGDNATGTSYCFVTLIGDENGKKMKNTMGVHYQDEFVRVNNQWLIAKRKSTFDWQDRQELEK